MGLDYALVYVMTCQNAWRMRDSPIFRHLKFTIPPCLILTLLYRPLLTRLDLYKISFLVTVGTFYRKRLLPPAY